ncbi:type II toxin-antitoxin system HicA family toxin [Thermus thalpophilus]
MGFSPQPRRGKGDHEVWKHPDGRIVVLDPGNDPPPVGTFNEDLEASGNSRRDVPLGKGRGWGIFPHPDRQSHGKRRLGKEVALPLPSSPRGGP